MYIYVYICIYIYIYYIKDELKKIYRENLTEYDKKNEKGI